MLKNLSNIFTANNSYANYTEFTNSGTNLSRTSYSIFNGCFDNTNTTEFNETTTPDIPKEKVKYVEQFKILQCNDEKYQQIPLLINLENYSIKSLKKAFPKCKIKEENIANSRIISIYDKKAI